MTKTKSTKHALIMSVMALFLCFTMLIGTTFAWFTDSVTSAGNIIQSGTLDVSMEWLKGTEEPSEDAAWKDASQGAIFDSMLWEPGYTEVRHIKIENEGTLSLKYNVAIQANGVVSKLSDAIDVYYIDPAQKIASGDELTADKKIGTLTEVLADLNNTGKGVLEAGEKDTITLALKMRENAGNEYQGLSIGTNFSIVLFATQYTGEFDSFDDQYDADAPKLFTVNGVGYDTAAEAMAAAKDGDKVVLSAVDTPIVIDKAIELTISNTNILADEGVNAITVNADAKIIVDGNNVVTGGKNGDGINVAEGVTLTLTGSGTLVARGNGGSETQAEYNAGKGGSGIDVAGSIVIDGLANLTAEGYGKHAFGIGGATQSIVIKDSTVNYAKGGMVKAAITDNNYGKQEPEAGAAIGSKTSGAVIEISNSTVHKAEGGSKAAGIGAMYHTGVTVKIDNSTVTAFGGTSSAGIGGSRVTKHASNDSQAINVEITKSTINATGGDFAAGIGSGYNTYCNAAHPIITVSIDADSDVSAQGGLLGAGVGTGHNVVDFVNNVACDTSDIKAGSSEDPAWCCWGNPCTIAEDIGLGVYSINNFSTAVTAENFDSIDFTKENEKFSLNGTFGNLEIDKLGNGSVLALNNATVGNLTIGSDATITGTGTLNQVNTARNSAEPVTLTITDATLDIAGELGVRNTDNKSVLNIENSTVYFGTIFVGEHTNNHKSALTEFNVVNSMLSGEENGLGSTINVWGRSGVQAKIYDSEIYTYSRGWHQSEDANDNAITFQGATCIDVDIQRSNMHLYGARSIINVRQYGSEETNINARISESLIWSVTKSNHGENTIPVWGINEDCITDSILLFTKNVYQSTDATFKSFVYGNPVIHGDYHVTTQCQWDAPIALADGQTVTFANDANVSIYDEAAGTVKFVKNGSANVVVEDGAVIKNIGGID